MVRGRDREANRAKFVHIPRAIRREREDTLVSRPVLVQNTVALAPIHLAPSCSTTEKQTHKAFERRNPGVPASDTPQHIVDDTDNSLVPSRAAPHSKTELLSTCKHINQT